MDPREPGATHDARPDYARLQSECATTCATKLSAGEGAMNALHRDLNNLRDEANVLAERLNAVLAPLGPPTPINGAAASSAPRGEVLASLESAADKVAQIRATLSGISDRYQF